jgi:RNA polymerase sigma factor (sigma-70 family)
MNAHETRGSQAVPDGKGLAHSQIDRNPPEAAGRFHASTRQASRISSSDEGATAGEAQSTSGSLSEAQLATFWGGIVANLDAARRMARKIVPRQSVDDVVHSAAVLYVEALQRQTSRFPESDDELRRFFLTTVQHHAHDCVRVRVVDRCPVHTHWAEAPEPRANGSTTPDRALDQVFARNDQRTYDAPAPLPRRPMDDLDNLNAILRSQLDKLSPAQREVIDETFFEGRSRAQIVQRRGISASTYDNHLQAAYRALRTAMMEVVKSSRDADRPYWYDLVEVLNERHAVKQLRRKSREKGKRSTSQHERSTFTGEASTVAPERGTIPPEGAASAASAAKSRGKRHTNAVARSAA